MFVFICDDIHGHADRDAAAGVRTGGRQLPMAARGGGCPRQEGCGLWVRILSGRALTYGHRRIRDKRSKTERIHLKHNKGLSLNGEVRLQPAPWMNVLTFSGLSEVHELVVLGGVEVISSSYQGLQVALLHGEVIARGL
mmetsp:Transcript_10493/g.35069  ORF Transcript_10493/g.35069 Transcript_10493/m.35069 type:complete len:139 (-) Transcript_10493:1117-1533(-)